MKIWSINETQNCLDFLEKHLAGRNYLLDEFSLADISVGYILFLIKISRNGKLMGDNVSGYLDRLMAREGFQQASALKPA